MGSGGRNGAGPVGVGKVFHTAYYLAGKRAETSRDP
jgi:hypothetical protein